MTPKTPSDPMSSCRRSGPAADSGAAYSTFSKDTEYRYVEVHAGVSGEAASARLYYSPNYFGGSIHTLYAELNGSYGISERFRLIGHAGLLQAFAGATAQTGGTHARADFLAGVEVQIAALRLQIGRVFADVGEERVVFAATIPA